jgi:hypothetical protein
MVMALLPVLDTVSMPLVSPLSVMRLMSFILNEDKLESRTRRITTLLLLAGAGITMYKVTTWKTYR